MSKIVYNQTMETQLFMTHLKKKIIKKIILIHETHTPVNEQVL